MTEREIINTLQDIKKYHEIQYSDVEDLLWGFKEYFEDKEEHSEAIMELDQAVAFCHAKKLMEKIYNA